MIPNFIYWAIHKRKLPITGTGEETRDFTFVDDIVEGTLRMGIISEAVGEAFNNIALHGFGDRDPSPVTIVMSFDGISVRVELRDHGAPFDPDRVAAPDLDSLPESGLGLYIIRAFVDRLDYRPGSPNVLVLTRYLDRAPTA